MISCATTLVSERSPASSDALRKVRFGFSIPVHMPVSLEKARKNKQKANERKNKNDKNYKNNNNNINTQQ